MSRSSVRGASSKSIKGEGCDDGARSVANSCAASSARGAGASAAPASAVDSVLCRASDAAEAGSGASALVSGQGLGVSRSSDNAPASLASVSMRIPDASGRTSVAAAVPSAAPIAAPLAAPTAPAAAPIVAPPARPPTGPASSASPDGSAARSASVGTAAAAAGSTSSRGGTFGGRGILRGGTITDHGPSMCAGGSNAAGGAGAASALSEARGGALGACTASAVLAPLAVAAAAAAAANAPIPTPLGAGGASRVSTTETSAWLVSSCAGGERGILGGLGARRSHSPGSDVSANHVSGPSWTSFAKKLVFGDLRRICSSGVCGRDAEDDGCHARELDASTFGADALDGSCDCAEAGGVPRDVRCRAASEKVGRGGVCGDCTGVITVSGCIRSVCRRTFPRGDQALDELGERYGDSCSGDTTCSMLRDSTRICVLRCGGERTGRLSCDSSEEHDVSSSSFSARAPPAAFDAECSTTVATETSAACADRFASVRPARTGTGASAGDGAAGAAGAAGVSGAA